MVKTYVEQNLENTGSPEYSNIQFIVNDFMDNSHSILSLSQPDNAQIMVSRPWACFYNFLVSFKM